MSDPLQEFLRAHPDASRRTTRRALGVSIRVVRRAEAALAERLARRRRRAAIALAAAVGLALVAALGLRVAADLRERQATAARERAAAAERALYAALDQDDRAQLDEARDQLAAEDDGARLAGVRYLAKVDPAGSAARLLPFVDDPSSRVRLATLRTLAGADLAGAVVDARLADVTIDRARPLGERALGLAALEARAIARTVVDPLQLARRLAVLLDDPSPLLAARAPALLARLEGRAPPSHADAGTATESVRGPARAGTGLRGGP